MDKLAVSSIARLYGGLFLFIGLSRVLRGHPLRSIQFDMPHGLCTAAGGGSFPEARAGADRRSWLAGKGRARPFGEAAVRAAGYALAEGQAQGSGNFRCNLLQFCDDFVTNLGRYLQDLQRKGVVLVQNLGLQCKIPVSGTIPVILSEQNLEMTFSSCREVFLYHGSRSSSGGGPLNPVGSLTTLSASRGSPRSLNTASRLPLSSARFPPGRGTGPVRSPVKFCHARNFIRILSVEHHSKKVHF